MEMQAMFLRKEVSFEPRMCRIEKAVMLDAEQFDEFMQNMLADYSFIERNRDIGGEAPDGRIRCFLVVGLDRMAGVLVNTEGSAYARYTAYLPDARKIYEDFILEGLALEAEPEEAAEGMELSI
jgi:hypothetical protein